MSSMGPFEQNIEQVRRNFLTSSASGLGLAALGAMLSADEAINPLAIRPPHFAPKAKNCIFLLQAGAPSQLDLFDPKPKLNELHGQPLPNEILEKVRFAFIKKESAVLMGSSRKWSKHGSRPIATQLRARHVWITNRWQLVDLWLRY